jgi:hypothetical protein
MNSRSGSLVFTINLKAEENIHAATILLFYVLRQYYLNKGHIFSQIYYHVVQQTCHLQVFTLQFCIFKEESFWQCDILQFLHLYVVLLV